MFSTIVYYYRKRKIDKDFYCFVKKFRLSDYYAKYLTDSPAGKTIRTIIGKDCRYNFDFEFLHMKGAQKDIEKVQDVLKVYKYILYRLENSKEYKSLITFSDKKTSKSTRFSLNKVFDEIFDEKLFKINKTSLNTILSEIMDSLIMIEENKNLASINIDVCFNGKNLLNFYNKEDTKRKCGSYNKFINNVLGFKLYKTYD